jgi:hypothetical protein
LAAAATITAFVELLILFVIMSRRIPKLFSASFVEAVLRMVSATGLTFVVTYVMARTFNLTTVGDGFFALLPTFALIVTVSGVAYLLFSKIFKIPEVDPVLERLKKIAFYKRKISS